MKKETIRTEDFLKENLIVLYETFEGSPKGSGSVYLDRGTGVFSTLAEIDAEMASVMQYGSSIAAHTEHLKFYNDRLREFILGRTEPVKWEQSWLIETVSEAEWDILRNGVRESYEALLPVIADIEEWNQDNIGEIVAVIAHTAYHLGSIRQMAKSFAQDSADSAEA